MKNTVVTFLAVIAVQITFAQGFTPDREKFVKEFHKSLSEYGKGDYSDLSKKMLPEILLEGSDFPEAYFTKMVSTANLILEKKLKPYPELYNYVFSVYSLVKAKQNQASFNAWHVTVDKMLDSRNVKRFEDFVELTAGFFSESILTNASNFTWYYFGGTYSFDYTDNPIIRFEGGNLVCRVANRDRSEAKKNPYIDSIVVIKTTGSFDPLLKKWDGKGGTITWQKVGFSPAETFAEINNYNIALKSSNFSADSVRLTTPYFDKPILGELAERAFIINREEDRVYPQFNSYEKILKIKDLKPNINYEGGFSLKGPNFEGVGSIQTPAKLRMMNNNQVFILAESQLFFVNDKKIRSEKASIYLKFSEKDSITHPGLSLTYESDKALVEMARTKTGIGQAPFGNSYHQVDMYIPKLQWIVGSDSLLIGFEFGTSQEQKIARMESKNYFDAKLYDQLQGMESVHPLVGIASYVAKNGRYNLNDGKLATSMGKTIDQARITLFELANLGFLSYDSESKLVNVNQKTINFVEARSAKRDYDNIIFISDLRPKELRGYSPEQIEKDPVLQAVKLNYYEINAYRSGLSYFGTLNLTTKELFLEGIDQVTISATQGTSVFPREYNLVIRENRDFNFQGYINTGKVEMDAEIADFKYNEFKFNVAKSNKTRLRVKPMQKEDGNRAIPMISQISGISGEIQIDEPNNRSGKDDKIIGYPKLNSIKPSYIYYNQKDIYKGAYDSSRFYYTVEPFVMDSLDDFDEISYRLKGELTSAGIFPKFKQDIRIMPDYSFGFATEAPKGGFPFYGSEAKYDNKIVLSGNGLQGSGTIRYLNSTSESQALSFLPDSTIGFAEFKNLQSEVSVEFPDVTGSNIYITYIPKNDILRAQTTLKNDLNFFKGQAVLKGTAYVTPKGMEGKGLMNFLAATIVSDKFTYMCNDIDADTSFFNLRNTSGGEGEDKVAFRTDNVKSHVSFKERKGEFASNGGSSSVEFPINQYRCKMDIFNWYMDKEEIDMESKDRDIAIDAGVDLIEPNFFSTNNKKDTLAFKAPLARFSLAEKTIYCDKVEYVDVADARIFPSDKKITVRKKARLDPLTDAKIIANYITKYHTFVKSNVEIGGKKEYTAVGDYPYYDADSNLTYLRMDKIGLDSSFQTIATGKVTAEMDFQLSNEFDYYGNVTVRAANPLLTFQGATKINHNCDKFERSWLSFSAPINPKNIQIPVAQEMTNLDGTRISAGIVWRDSKIDDSIRIYPTFLSSLQDPKDPILLTANGVLQYDFSKQEYQIGSQAKFKNPTEKGNIIALNTKTCSMSGSGIVELGMDYGDAQVLTYGDIKYDQATGVTQMDMTMKFKMDLDKGIFQDIGTRMSAVPASENMDLENINLEKALVEWADAKTADKFKSDYTIKGEVKKMPDVLSDGIVISGIQLKSFEKFDFQERGLVTSTTSAVMVNVYDKSVFKVVDFDAFFLQSSSVLAADKFSMLISMPGGKIYFFDYTMQKKDGELRIISSDKDFVTAINAVKEEKRKSKNFKYGITEQNIYVAKFNRLLGKREE